jgi:hypothetical protein
MSNEPSIFSRYISEPENEPSKPETTIPRGPLLRPIVPPTNSKSSPAEQLLDFIVNRWHKPVIRVREICRFGPGSIRDRKSAMALAETLVANGWLSSVKGRQHNEKMWMIVRGPNQINEPRRANSPSG